MGEFLAGLRRWYLRRFRGIVEPPRLVAAGVVTTSVGRLRPGGQGTTWFQHPRNEQGFTCRCNMALAFTEDDYRILSQDHVEGCTGLIDGSTGDAAKATSIALDLRPCACPVLESRYVKICRQCHTGHWKLALPLSKEAKK